MFFLRWLFCGGQKNESVFCAVSKNFRGVEIFFIFFVRLPFKAVSVVVPSISKTVRSKHKSFKFAGC
jgi:hypothetical protein